MLKRDGEASSLKILCEHFKLAKSYDCFFIKSVREIQVGLTSSGQFIWNPYGYQRCYMGKYCSLTSHKQLGHEDGTSV